MNEVTKIQTETQEIAAPDPMVAMIERVAMSPDLPVDRLTALMDMRERQMEKEAEQVFNQAFAEAMAAMPDVPKSGKNNHTRQTYSTLDDLIKTARPILAARGLSLNWTTKAEGGEYHVTAVVRHAMGHSIKTTLSGPRDSGKQMNALQGGGSTETYLKRYTGFSILGLSSGDEVDDDGRGADAATVSAEQYIAIRDRAAEAGVPEDKICLAHKCESLQQLPAAAFHTAMKRLQKNIDAKGGENG
jgi:hypothetical protein